MGSMWLDPAEDPKIYPAQGLPVPNFDETMINVDAGEYPEKRWGADFRSLLWLSDFTDVQGWPSEIAKGIPRPPAIGSREMIDGLKALVLYQQTLRTEALPEILAQSVDFQLYFCSQLGIYPRSYPRSYLLLKVAARIGELAMVKLKFRFARLSVRPSHVYPRLTPPIAVPPHASYPSGHGLIGHLLARTAQAIQPSFGDAPTRLARRIATNREIAGLHFRWDSLAGEIAAANVFAIVENMRRFKDELPLAQQEWR